MSESIVVVVVESKGVDSCGYCFSIYMNSKYGIGIIEMTMN
jgi:hypothetical protein